jgi:hypothetical protein
MKSATNECSSHSQPGTNPQLTLNDLFNAQYLSCDLAIVNPCNGNYQNDPIYSYIRRMVGAGDIDLANEIFNQTWQIAFDRIEAKLTSLNSSIKGSEAKLAEVVKWLKVIARNKLDHWRSQAYKRYIVLDFDEPYGLGDNESKGAVLYSQQTSTNPFYEAKDEIEYLIGKSSPLSEKHKEVIVSKLEVVFEAGIARYHLCLNDSEASEKINIKTSAFFDRKELCRRNYRTHIQNK